MLRGAFLWFIVLPLFAWSQVPFLLEGVVQDARTARPLADVHVRFESASGGTVSDADGRFSIPVRGPGTLVFSRVAYAKARVWVQDGKQAKGDLQVRLEPLTIDLPGVTISAPGPEIVYQRSDLHVGDHFVNDEGIWVLTYERPRLWHPETQAGRQVYREARLHLLDTAFVERCSIRLPTEVERLRHDHAQRAIVEGLYNAWAVEELDGRLVLHEMDLTTLRERVLPWTDSIQGALIGSDRTETFPAFTHFMVDQSGTATPICAVENAHVMELFRSQYKYMSGPDKVIAMDLGRDHGVDPEIIAGFMTRFYEDIYFEPVNAPLFVIADTLCVFDHDKARIRRFLGDPSPVDEVPISYHRDRAWTERLLQDPVSEQVFACFSRSLHTWLRSVDVSTGALGPQRTLEHPYPEDVQVHDGHAYYIYRPYGSLQKRTLYRQRIQ